MKSLASEAKTDALVSAVNRTGRSIENIPDLLRQVVENRAWTDRERGPNTSETFSSFRDFCTTDPPEGLGCDIDRLRDLCETADPEDNTEVRALLTHKLGQHGGDRSGGKGNASDLDPNERGSDYLTARIARDHPEVHERMKDGEFSSVRQAAIEAGIIDDIRTKQIRETDDPEKMEAKIRHVYGDEVADRLFGGEAEEQATEEKASGEKDAPSLEKVAVDSDPEDLFDISGLSRRQQNALLAGAISSSTPRTSGLALQVHYNHEELAECFGAALEQVNEWDAEDIARVACGQSDELTFSDWEGAEE